MNFAHGAFRWNRVLLGSKARLPEPLKSVSAIGNARSRDQRLRGAAPRAVQGRALADFGSPAARFPLAVPPKKSRRDFANP
jgi:hypothetical protein